MLLTVIADVCTGLSLLSKALVSVSLIYGAILCRNYCICKEFLADLEITSMDHEFSIRKLFQSSMHPPFCTIRLLMIRAFVQALFLKK